ncbi:MAG TPA: class I SAM-dependent methyltransferase [Candidatus Xenobia bacterium]|jgi:2-polyprenyl-3-methyl-5-hydroxy-6-metoxy-1,4-benzoquinol methylase
MAVCPLCQSSGETRQTHAGYQVKWCRDCDFGFVDPPMPKTEHRTWHNQDFFVRYYGESIESFYARKGALYQREVAKKAWMVEQLRRHVPSGRILDIGTGQGLFSYTARDAGYDVHATEVCPMDVAYHRSQGLDVFDGYIEDAHFDGNSFDAVTMWHTLEHVYDPLGTLTEVCRILKPGGYLVGALPNWRGIGTQARLVLGHPLFDPATDHELHFFHYSPRALKIAFEKSGLKPISIGQEWHRPRRMRDKLVTWTGNALSVLPGINCRETMTMAALKP